VGPGPVIVNLDILMNYKVMPIWNVIATIDGETDETVMIGNHRDAWIFGAGDPNSGSVALLEVARGFTELKKKGWKPKRSIMLCSWDGEEYGLLGSTAFADKNGEWVSNKVVAYVNVDVGVVGNQFSVDGTHSLDNLIHSVAADIIDPNTGKPLSQIWSGSISTLGSGSDYTAYIDHYGVACLDFGFNGNYAGVYHSKYDSLHWMEAFGDPQFKYFVAVAQFWGVTTLRLVDSDVLPFNYVEDADYFLRFFSDIEKMVKEYGGEDMVKLDGLLQAIQNFKNAAGNISTNSSLSLQQLNSKLYLAERQFLGKGLPLRPYYKHVIQAPGLYLGYGTQTFPGIAQAVQEKDWTLANSEVDEAKNRIQLAADWLSS